MQIKMKEWDCFSTSRRISGWAHDLVD